MTDERGIGVSVEERYEKALGSANSASGLSQWLGKRPTEARTLEESDRDKGSPGRRLKAKGGLLGELVVSLHRITGGGSAFVVAATGSQP